MISGQTKGIKSTEFWVSILGMLAGTLCALFSDSQWAQVAGPIAAVICGAAYTNARKTVKAAIALGGAKVDAARIASEATEAVGKSKE
jgi:hypothetical protein